jgi:hypothetical protein
MPSHYGKDMKDMKKKPAKKTPAKKNGNGKKKTNGLTAKQKKLPVNLQKAILNKKKKK